MNVKRVFAVAGAAVLLTIGTTGCGNAAKKAINHELKQHGVNVNDSSVTIKDDSGNTVTYGNTKLPDGFPKEIKLPDGSTISAASKQSTDSGTEFTVIFGSSKSADDVTAFFKKELSDAGYKKQDGGSINFEASGGSYNSLTYANSDHVVTIATADSSDSEKQSIVTLDVAPADKSASSDSGSGDTGGSSDSGNPLSS